MFNNYDYKIKDILSAFKEDRDMSVSILLTEIIRNGFAIISGYVVFNSMQSPLVIKLATLSIVILSIMNNDTSIQIFKWIKECCCFILGISFSIYFWKYGKYMIEIEHYIIVSSVIGLISFSIMEFCTPKQNQTIGSIKRTLAKIFGCIFFYMISILLFAFLYRFIRLPRILAFIITFFIYVIYSLDITCSDDL